ncbi:hypothetical protein [Burkholderia vietnamiensis]|uniref:hypothetical protein n=1 Tax=Burkholderia vietnamiensis TaxID=60552 RepID=UPI000841BC15|nr:hypothetical protein [Burkholderia vietnamiensis]AOK11005.1 hypothetical protein WK31_12565 [Burkholderia vietnamiensis]
MHPIIAKSFGGLSTQYYVRQFLFGLIFPALLLFVLSRGSKPVAIPVGALLFFAVNCFLYPYSRFVYEGIVDYIVGRNVFFLPALVVLFFKWMTMALCWSCAIFIAPVGLLYLYVRNSRQSAI